MVTFRSDAPVRTPVDGTALLQIGARRRSIISFPPRPPFPPCPPAWITVADVNPDGATTSDTRLVD